MIWEFWILFQFRLTVMPSESSDSSKTSPSLSRVSSLSRKNAAACNGNRAVPKSVSRDSMKVVNEKAVVVVVDSNGKTTTTTTTEEDDDSDEEKLSPLLNNKSKSQQKLNESAALKMAGVDENIDDGDEEEDPRHEVGIDVNQIILINRSSQIVN